MENYEALQAAIAGNTVIHAKRLHVSTSLLGKWQEPCTDFTDSGCYNPIDRLDTIIYTAFDIGTPPEKARMPIYQLNHNHDLVACPVPPLGGHKDAVNAALIATIKEFAELAETTAAALADNRISPIDARNIVTDAQEALRAIGILIHAVRQAVR